MAHVNYRTQPGPFRVKNGLKRIFATESCRRPNDPAGLQNKRQIRVLVLLLFQKQIKAIKNLGIFI